VQSLGLSRQFTSKGVIPNWVSIVCLYH